MSVSWDLPLITSLAEITFDVVKIFYYGFDINSPLDKQEPNQITSKFKSTFQFLFVSNWSYKEYRKSENP